MGLPVGWRLWVAAALVATLGPADAAKDPAVTIRAGQLSGTTVKSLVGNTILAFKGIPYAEPPLGKLRFQPPRPHPGWAGVRKAKMHGNKCLQPAMFIPNAIEGDEDCLFLNVYTPRLPSAVAPSNLPVMVWIHGGGFLNGDGNAEFYGPGYLVDRQVVLVTINYRLNVFGFLTTGDSEAPGNYGMHDQALALQWVQENIAAFGGDPEAVTIFGESAGGASIGLHVLSPRSTGLFSKAISQSGASFCYFGANGAEKTENAKKHAELLGCDTLSSQSIVECMRQIPAKKIMEAMNNVDKELLFAILYKPRVDAEAETPFLPENPFVSLKEGRFNRVPWMNGFNADEGALMVTMFNNIGAGDVLKGKDWAAWAKKTLELEHVTKNPAETAEQIYKHYYGDDSLSDSNMGPAVDMITDRGFASCITSEVELASAHTPVYKYFLDHSGPGRQNIAAMFSRLQGKDSCPDLGVSHAEDLLYLFTPVFAPPIAVDSAEHKMVRFMVSVWTNFARHGVPSTDVVAMPSWPVFTMEKKQHMRLNLSPSVDSDLYEERMQFWRQLDIAENWRMPVSGSRKDEL